MSKAVERRSETEPRHPQEQNKHKNIRHCFSVSEKSPIMQTSHKIFRFVSLAQNDSDIYVVGVKPQPTI